MPRSKESVYHALRLFKECSEEADKYNDNFPSDSKFDEWIETVKENFIKLRDCDSVENVQKGPEIASLFVKSNNVKPIEEVKLAEQRTHIHDNKIPPINEPESVPSSSKKYPLSEYSTPKRSSNTSVTQPALSSAQDQTPRSPVLASISESRILRSSKNKSSNASSSGAGIGLSKSTAQKSIKNEVLAVHLAQKNTLATPGTNSVLSAIPVHISNPSVSNEAFRKTPLSGPKRANPIYKVVPTESYIPSIYSTPINPNRQAKKSALSNIPAMCSTPVNPIRQPKRKSSVQREESTKRKKVNPQAAHPTSRRSGNSNKKVLQKNYAPKAAAGDNSGKKVAACIAPTAPKKLSEVPKEVQIMEDIKKREAKAEENRQKLLAKKQLKMEENKKKREERRLKMIEKKLEMEKEKQQFDFQKAQAMKDLSKPAKPVRVKELADQHAKENAQAAVRSAEKHKLNTTEVLKTPVSAKSPPSDTYDVTPLPDSSIYDSDNEDAPRTRGKHIPLWAQGLHLKNALFQQYYNPANEKELFGSMIEPPDLTVIFQTQKRHYLKRTSSAIWQHPLF